MTSFLLSEASGWLIVVLAVITVPIPTWSAAGGWRQKDGASATSSA